MYPGSSERMNHKNRTPEEENGAGIPRRHLKPNQQVYKSQKEMSCHSTQFRS